MSKSEEKNGITPEDKESAKRMASMVFKEVIDATNELLDGINDLLEGLDPVYTQAERREDPEYKAMMVFYDRVRRVLDEVESILDK